MRKVCLLLTIFLFSGCATKKVQKQLNDYQKSNEAVIVKTANETVKSADTSTVTTLETNTEKIEFFNPSEINDYDLLISMMQERGEPYSEMGIIKSITKIVDRAKETRFDTLEEVIITQEEVETISDNEISKEEIIKIETVTFWQKYKWYFILFGAFLICILLVFMGKRFRLLVNSL